MFPFLSDTQKQYGFYAKFAAEQLNAEDNRLHDEREAIEAQYREDYGDDYIEDEELTPNQVKAWMNRINANQCQ